MTLSVFRLFFIRPRAQKKKKKKKKKYHGPCLLIVDDRNKVAVFAGTKRNFEDPGETVLETEYFKENWHECYSESCL